MKLEELREQVEAISRAVSEMRSSGISERALIILIQANTKGHTPTKALIAALLDSIETLEDFITEDEEG